MTLRDERSRLLGYIVYPLKSTSDARRLRAHLKNNNRFHNVLVVYPREDQASLELWQGQQQLNGKLRKGQGYKDAADVVNLLSRFFVVSKAKVRNPTDLAHELAYRARYLRRLAVKQLKEEPKKGQLRNLYNAFKEALVHDQSEDEFADAFAQTITYGLLTARWTGHNELEVNGERLTRQTALKYLPAASAFLNDLFKSALSVRLDEQRGRLLWLVDDIADLLDRIDVTYVFGVGNRDADAETDPVIHFYEPFLAAYDNEMKNKRGVFFTPRPVVSYIVRTVHQVLQKEFGLEDGLASTDTWGDVATRIKNLKLPNGVEHSHPFVSILDPATGTGTFLFECIDVIERTMKARWCLQTGAASWNDPRITRSWTRYVQESLLPRLYGYELMMASYAVAHLKLSFKLGETGYQIGKKDRLHIYLTNSLEGPSNSANSKLARLFESLATQSQEVDEIKRARRFTVVIGNPPYAGHSSNTGHWARALVERYRRIAGRQLRLVQGKWLQNDYVKFIALAETTVAQSQAGVWGFISDHSYLDGDTFPGLRYGLLNQFAGLEILNLHGSLTRRERPPAGGPDENVFDIQQGVAISIGWRGSESSPLGHLSVADLWGTRESKFRALRRTSCRSKELGWRRVKSFDDRYLFVAVGDESDADREFEAFDAVDDIFSENGKPAPGFLTTHDSFAISFSKKNSIANVETLLASKSEDDARGFFKLCSQAQWQYEVAKAALQGNGWRKHVRPCLYRPFDERWTVYEPHVLVHRRERVNSHLLELGNLALLTTRMTKGDDFSHVFVSDKITEVICLSSKTSANAFVFPLFLRDDQRTLRGLETLGTRSNISPKILKAYRALFGKAVTSRTVFMYSYAILHSPAYRRRYNNRLTREFPRIPKPRVARLFSALAKSGERLVTAHLFEDSTAKRRLQGTGNGVVGVGMPKFDPQKKRININRTQYYEPVSEEVWKFRVGSYEVCKKWLTVRRGRLLSNEDASRFSQMIDAIEATIEEQKEIDEVIAKHGGWPSGFEVSSTGRSK